jgi:osmoprotectant transport system ATP-binding protein
MFTLSNVTKAYAGRTALGPISIDVPDGRTTVLIGPSGCGKSTLLRLLIGLVEPETGAVAFRGEPGTSFKTAASSRI